MAEPHADAPPSLPRPRRRKLWELDNALHCSVVGTCLTLGDLRRIQSRLKIVTLKDASDYKVHGSFVVWAGRQGPAADRMHKLLERRYAIAIRRFAAATEAAALQALWTQSREDGDIPGPYWALLTHPAADTATAMWAFGQVHMLSHIVGTSNRADIRRLTMLQDERDTLAEALSQTKRRLSEQDRDARRMLDQHASDIREFSERLSAAATLSCRLQQAEQRIADLESGNASRHLQTELAAARSAHSKAEQDARGQRATITTLILNNERLDQERARLERALQALAAECGAVEALLREQLAPAACSAPEPVTAAADAINLCGRRIVYVGGRGSVVPHLRTLVERVGGVFVHHDGGLEEAGCRLDRLLGQCDAVFCPIDCISHDACQRAKRACRQRASTFVPLRTCSLSSFAEALRRLALGETSQETAAQSILPDSAGSH